MRLYGWSIRTMYVPAGNVRVVGPAFAFGLSCPSRPSCPAFGPLSLLSRGAPPPLADASRAARSDACAAGVGAGASVVVVVVGGVAVFFDGTVTVNSDVARVISTPCF